MEQTEETPRTRQRIGSLRLVREEPFNAPEGYPSWIESFTHHYQIFKLMQPYAARESVEVFWMIPLDSALKPLVSDPIVIGIGGINAVLAHAREVFRPAIALGAYGIVVVHNHPSGNPEPSARDREVTSNLFRAGKIIGIELLDHIIIGEGRYTAMSDTGLLIAPKEGGY